MADTISITIQGVTFTARAPYPPGHVCTPTEAGVLNQCRADNLRNNFSKTVKQALNGRLHTAEVLDSLHAKFRDYDNRYEFQAPSIADPVEAEARRIAAALVREQLSRRGKEATKDQFADFVDRVSQQAGVLAEAERRVAARREVAASTAFIIDEA